MSSSQSVTRSSANPADPMGLVDPRARDARRLGRLEAALNAGRRRGAARLREALPQIRVGRGIPTGDRPAARSEPRGSARTDTRLRRDRAAGRTDRLHRDRLSDISGARGVRGRSSPDRPRTVEPRHREACPSRCRPGGACSVSPRDTSTRGQVPQSTRCARRSSARAGGHDVGARSPARTCRVAASTRVSWRIPSQQHRQATGRANQRDRQSPSVDRIRRVCATLTTDRAN